MDIECLVNLRNEINNTINSVEDEDCRLLLEKRYIGMKKWEDIALDLSMGLDNVFKLHKKALNKISIPKTLQ